MSQHNRSHNTFATQANFKGFDIYKLYDWFKRDGNVKSRHGKFLNF